VGDHACADTQPTPAWVRKPTRRLYTDQEVGDGLNNGRDSTESESGTSRQATQAFICSSDSFWKSEPHPWSRIAPLSGLSERQPGHHKGP
jgi:hypothetical protein